jgi:serine/threonine-protein kinase
MWADDFNAPHDEPLLLANTTLARLGVGYADRGGDASRMAVSGGDYRVFIRQYDRFDRFAAGEGGADDAMLDSLKAIRARSPQFVDAYLLESKVARYLFEVGRDPRYLERARAVARNAQLIEPGDPRTVARVFDAAIAAGDISEANAALQSLRRVDPGNIAILRQEAQLARKEGDTKRALALMEKVVARRPARLYVQELADLERALGHQAAAHAHLQELLTRFPSDNYVRSKLAELELSYGDPREAERLYAELVARSPGAVNRTNLGLARMLLGNYKEAAADFRRAVEQAPLDPVGFLNLADCLKMAGRYATADSLYRHTLALIEPDPDAEQLGNLRMRAQCFAHTGRHQEAVSTIQDALRRDPEDPWTLYAAAVVYAVIGEHASALVSARRAVEKGVQARWLGIDLFAGLRGDPAFSALISDNSAAGKPAN